LRALYKRPWIVLKVRGAQKVGREGGEGGWGYLFQWPLLFSWRGANMIGRMVCMLSLIKLQKYSLFHRYNALSATYDQPKAHPQHGKHNEHRESRVRLWDT